MFHGAPSLVNFLSQVVLLGAGFDARALRHSDMGWDRLAQHDDEPFVFFEVDLPSVIRAKEAVLAALEHNMSTNGGPVVCRLSADLMLEDWVGALRAAGLRTDRPACVLLEGLLYFFEEALVNRTMAAVGRICPPGSRLGLSAVSRAASGEEPAREPGPRRAWYGKREGGGCYACARVSPGMGAVAGGRAGLQWCVHARERARSSCVYSRARVRAARVFVCLHGVGV